MRSVGSPRQITSSSTGHILTNVNVWSSDSEWIVYDTRSDPAGSCFDGETIERVHVPTGCVEILFRSRGAGILQAHCGVATFSPQGDRVVFILGPEEPSNDWPYSAYHRRGVMVDVRYPGCSIPLDAMNYAPPFTPGALRGGSHVHVFSPRGDLISFTYEDHVLASKKEFLPNADINQRNVGVSWLNHPVSVNRNHERNHDGTAFSALVTRTVRQPVPGSDEISKAYEDAWIGNHGYLRADGAWQADALAFLGDVIDEQGKSVTELFVVDLPSGLPQVGSSPLEGTSDRRPGPPLGTIQRRLTRTSHRPVPGIRGPRHWPRSHPNGTAIACLMTDPETGLPQIHLIATTTGAILKKSHLENGAEGAFTWSPCGRWIAIPSGGAIHLVSTESGDDVRITTSHGLSIRPEACVFSPDGQFVAFVGECIEGDRKRNQIFVASVPSEFRTR